MLKWLVVLACVGGCKDRTELMIGVATDLRAPDTLDGARLVVSREGVPVHDVSWDITGSSIPENLPGSYGIFSDGDELQVDVSLQGFKNGDAILDRRALVTFIEGRTLFFRMTLVAGCVDRTDCSDNQSCIEGSCQDREVDSRTLPEFEDNLVTELTCLSGPMYIDTATNLPMTTSADAAACPSNLCSEGVCHVDPTTMGGGMSDGGTDFPVLPPHTYVMDKQTLNNTRTLDLDGDGVKDNQMGQVLNIFANQGFPVQPTANLAVDQGRSITLINLGAGDLDAGGQATFAVFDGANPSPPACLPNNDPVCRRHLDGSGTFEISPSAPRDQPLLGSIAGGTLDAGPGNLSMNAVLTTPLTVDLIGARVHVTSISEVGLTGTIGGAITQSDLTTKIIPAWVSDWNAQLAADCGTTPPNCGCTPSSSGESLQALFDDAPNDCVISVAEVQGNSLLQSLLSPDVTIDGVNALSFSFDFTAVRGGFQVPN